MDEGQAAVGVGGGQTGENLQANATVFSLLEQSRTTERLAWPSFKNSHSLCRPILVVLSGHNASSLWRQ